MIPLAARSDHDILGPGVKMQTPAPLELGTQAAVAARDP